MRGRATSAAAKIYGNFAKVAVAKRLEVAECMAGARGSGGGGSPTHLIRLLQIYLFVHLCRAARAPLPPAP